MTPQKAAYSKEYRERNREKARTYSKERWKTIKADPIRHAKFLEQARHRSAYRKEYSKKFYIENSHKWREYNLKSKYELTVEELNSLIEKQGNVCAICLEATPTHIDHDHSCCPGKRSCGKCIRAVLCSRCNQGIGYFKDSPERLINAAEYIKKHKKLEKSSKAA